jgi:hypothetical protein
MTTDFFESVLTEYLEDDRLENGVVRLELDDGRTRRFVVSDDTESLDTFEYVQRELEEAIHLIEENEELFDQPVELSVPVRDEDRVVDEIESESAVTTWFKPDGFKLALEHLLAMLEEGSPSPDGAAPESEEGDLERSPE